MKNNITAIVVIFVKKIIARKYVNTSCVRCRKLRNSVARCRGRLKSLAIAKSCFNSFKEVIILPP